MEDVPDNFLLLQYPTERSVIQSPNLRVANVTQIPKSDGGNEFAITLTTEAVAPFVFLNLRSNQVLGWFSDNGFIMVSPTQTVYFQSRNYVNLTEFQNGLEVLSLHDVVDG